MKTSSTAHVLGAFVVVSIVVALVTIVVFGSARVNIPADRPSTASNVEDGVERDTAPPALTPVGDAPPLLLSPNVDYSQVAASLVTDPVKLCQDMNASVTPSTPWQHSLVDSAAFECSSVVAPLDVNFSGESTEPSTMFYIFRGTDASRVTTLRLKLNLLNDGDASRVLKMARNLLSRLQDYPDIALPQSVMEAVMNRTPIALSGDTATIRFSREISDARRFNLTVDYRPGRIRRQGLSALLIDARMSNDVLAAWTHVPQPVETTAKTRMSPSAVGGKAELRNPTAVTPQLPIFDHLAP